MKIERNGVAIELTPEEVRKAYDQYYHECLIMDAERHFKEWLEPLGYGPDEDEHFEERYGFTIADALNPLSPHYLLERFTSAFEGKFDTGEAERTIWFSAINHVMDALPTPEGKFYTYRVIYKEELYYHYDVRAHSKREAEKIWNRENKAGNPRFQVTDPDVIGFADVYDVHLKEEDDHGKHRRTEEVL